MHASEKAQVSASMSQLCSRRMSMGLPLSRRSLANEDVEDHQPRRVQTPPCLERAAGHGQHLGRLVLGSVEEMDTAFAAMHSEQVEALMLQPLFIVALG